MSLDLRPSLGNVRDEMPNRPDPFLPIAAKRAVSPEVARLFEELARRAEISARMLDEFTETVVRHREAREGRPFRLTKGQQKFIAEAECDADKEVQKMERHAMNLDDAALLMCTLSSECMQMDTDERLFSGWHSDDREAARRMMEFRRETIRLIEQFVESSPFKGKVKSIWHETRKPPVI